MKKTSILIAITAVLFTSCNQTERLFDSEISAIRDNTKVLEQLVEEQKKHNQLLEEQNKIFSKNTK